jgi:hypothetical protein
MPSRADFTYDVLEPNKVAKAIQRALRFVPGIVRPMHTWLRTAQHPGRAQFAPRAIRAFLDRGTAPNWLHGALLSAETHIVDELVALASEASRARQDLEEDPRANVTLFTNGKMLVRTLRRRLRNLDGKGGTFRSLGAIGLFFATAHLNPRPYPRDRPEIILRIKDQATGKLHVLAI